MGFLRMSFGMCFGFALLAPIATTHAGSDAKAPLKDAYGDPLPRGAIARLGTVRFLHPGGIGAVAISRDGKIVATSIDNLLVLGDHATTRNFETIHFWDGKTGRRIRTIAAPYNWLSQLQFIDNDRRLAGTGPGFVAIWDLNNGKKIEYRTTESDQDWLLRAHQIVAAGDQLFVVFSGAVEYSTNFLEIHPQNALRIWNLRTGERMPLHPMLQSSINCDKHIADLFHTAAISPNAKYIAVVRSEAHPVIKNEQLVWRYDKRRLQIIEMKSGQIIFDKKDTTTKRLLFSPTGNRLVVAGEKELWRIDIATKKETRITEKAPSGFYPFAFAGPSDVLAGQSGDRIIFWDMNGRESTRSHASQWQHLNALSKDGRFFARVSGNTVRVRSVQTGEFMGGFSDSYAPPYLIQFSSHQSDVLFAEYSERLFVWDLQRQKVKKAILLPKTYTEQRFEPYSGSVANAAYDKRRFLGSKRKDFGFRNLVTGQMETRVKAVKRPSSPAIFAANGSRVIIECPRGRLDGAAELQVFDVATGKKLSNIDDRFDYVTMSSLHAVPFAFSSRGRYFANDSDKLRIFDTNTGQIVGKPFDERVYRCGFSLDEKYLVCEHHKFIGSESVNVTVFLHDVETARSTRRVSLFKFPNLRKLHRSILNAMAISIDNRLLAAVNLDASTIQLYEVASGQKRGEFRGHLEPVLDLAFSPDGKYLASSSDDRTILVWDLHRPLTTVPIKKRLTQNDLTTHWQTLANRDAKNAEASIWSMIYASIDSIPFLTKNLPLIAKPDAKRLDQLIRDLGGDFRVRSKASSEIEKLGELALPQLQAALKDKSNLETKRRLKLLVKKAEVDRFHTDADRLRKGRALEVLEKIGNSEARRLLRRLAGGAEGAWLTREAAAALERLERFQNAPAR